MIYKGKWRISGTVSDDWAGVDAIYIGYFANMDDSTMGTTYATEASLSPSGTPTLNRWFKISSPSATWSHNFDTKVITATNKANYQLYIVAIDKAGENVDDRNLKYISRQFQIDQDKDKPTLSIISPTTASRVNPGSLISGVAEDDDSGISGEDGLDYIYWFVGKKDSGLNFGGGVGTGDPTSDYNNWNLTNGHYTVNAKSGRIDLSATYPLTNSWQITSPSGVGDYKVSIVAVDRNGKASAVKTREFKQLSTDVPTITVTN